MVFLRQNFALTIAFLMLPIKIIRLRVSIGLSFMFDIIRIARRLAIVRIGRGVSDTVLI